METKKIVYLSTYSYLLKGQSYDVFEGFPDNIHKLANQYWPGSPRNCSPLFIQN